MAFSGQVLHNPVSGERFVFHTTQGLRTVAAPAAIGERRGLGERYRQAAGIRGESA